MVRILSTTKSPENHTILPWGQELASGKFLRFFAFWCVFALKRAVGGAIHWDYFEPLQPDRSKKSRIGV